MDKLNRNKYFEYLTADLTKFKEIWMVFEIQTEAWTSPKMRIWTLIQEFNSKDFELQTNDNLGPDKGFRIEDIWIQLKI
jgi:hypothetical protein